MLSLDELISKIRIEFNKDKVDIDYIKNLLSSYKASSKDWQKYVYFDRHRYTRNLVDTGNGKYNLIIIGWSEGQGTSIHDHSNSHCCMKILSGCLSETQFDWPTKNETYEVKGNDHNQEVNELKIINERNYEIDEVAYINDSIGLHRMENQSHCNPAVSLHLYAPPIDMCQIFDQRTGRRTTVKCTFNSIEGKRTPYKVRHNEGYLTFEKD